MAEWIEYTGSDEQIESIKLNSDGIIFKDSSGIELNSPIRSLIVRTKEEIKNFLKDRDVKSILLCKRHDLSQMIYQQAKTGQPVWIRQASPRHKNKKLAYKTTKPNWYLPDAEYSFESFAEKTNE